VVQGRGAQLAVRTLSGHLGVGDDDLEVRVESEKREMILWK
jgi:hypothetical protein